jgi:GxxExxY protein
MKPALKKYDDVPDAMNLLSGAVVDAIFKVHKHLGPGFLEKIYEECLCMELSDRKLPFERQQAVKMTYNGRRVPADFRLDLVIDRKILIELKSVDQLHPIHEAQIHSYLKMSGLPLGFLVNFNVPLIKDGMRRFVPKHLRNSGSPGKNSSEEV